MSAPASTPHLDSLGVMLGAGLLDQLREMATQGAIDYNKLSISFILELRALVYTTKAKKGVKPPSWSITNVQFANILFFIAKKSELQALPDKENMKKFLTDKRKYEVLEASLREGTLLPGDLWEELGSYLGLEQREPLVASVPTTGGLLEQQEQQPALSSQATKGMDQLDFDLASMVPGRLPHLAASELLAGTPDAGEVARRVRGGLSQPSMLTNPAVCELLELKASNILSTADIVSCVWRTLRGPAPVTRAMDSTIRYCLRQTEDTVARGVAQGDEQWDFAGRVKAVTAVMHPLTTLGIALQDIMSLASHCINCNAANPNHYCRSCMVACYCSSECQHEHWAAGHIGECGDVVARLHGTAGLQPPLPDLNPEVQAMRMKASRAQGRAHHTMCLLMGALGQVEEVREQQLEMAEQCREKDKVLKDKDEENARLSRIMGGLKRGCEEMEQKNKKLAKDKKEMKLEAAEEIRRMAAEEGGSLYLLRPHEALPGQHIDLFVGRRVPVMEGVGFSLFVRIPPDSRAPTNQQVTKSCVQSRSHSLHEVAQLLSHTVGRPEEERLAGLHLLYGQLVLQQSGLFASLVTTNRAVISALLWQSPEQTSAAQHSNGLANTGMEKLRRVLKKSLGFSPFSCKGNVARHDQEVLYYVTKENFEVIKLQLYQTANSTVPSPCAALRARNLPNYLELMVRRVLEEQQDSSTKNLRHPLYRGRLVVIIELDKGGKIMKFAWRLGANRLVLMGAFKATDSHGNMLIFFVPWFGQLKEIMECGVIVPSADFQEIAALDQEAGDMEKEPVLRDLRTVLPQETAEPMPGPGEEPAAEDVAGEQDPAAAPEESAAGPEPAVAQEAEKEREQAASLAGAKGAGAGGHGGTLLKPATAITGPGGKQIILQKPGGGRPQIVTLVKTSQGMQVVTMPKRAQVQGVQAALGQGGIKTVEVRGGGQQLLALPAQGLVMQHGGDQTMMIGGKPVQVLTSMAGTRPSDKAVQLVSAGHQAGGAGQKPEGEREQQAAGQVLQLQEGDLSQGQLSGGMVTPQEGAAGPESMDMQQYLDLYQSQLDGSADIEDVTDREESMFHTQTDGDPGEEALQDTTAEVAGEQQPAADPEELPEEPVAGPEPVVAQEADKEKEQVAEEPAEAPVVAVQEKVQEEIQLMRRLAVHIQYAGDMAGFYALLGLSGAAGLFPSLFTLVTKAHLAEHANHDRPHNWENVECIFPFRSPAGTIRNAQACSRDKRNGGAMEKNARHHQGSKAAPIIPFPAGLKDFLDILSTCPLHVDLGVLGKWAIDRGLQTARILDGKASEAELADISDQLLEERGEEEEEGEGEPANSPQPGPITRERTRLQQELLERALEKELAELENEEKQEQLVKLEVVLPRLVAVMEGDEETLLAISKKSGASYFKKKFKGDSQHLTCSSHCILTGFDRDVKIVKCGVCALSCHSFCEARLGQEEMDEAAPLLACRRCEAKAADPAASPEQLGTSILNRLCKEVEDEITDNLEKQRLLGIKVELLGRAVEEVEEEKKKDMGHYEKKFEEAMTKDVKAFRQTFSSHQLTGAGITKVLEGRHKLVAVFADHPDIASMFADFFDNYYVYHHIAMSQQQLTPERLVQLELAIRNISILLATKFKCRITPKMDMLLMMVVPFARRHGSIGLYREERIESLHARINTLQHLLASIRNPEERLLLVFQRNELKELNLELGKAVPRSATEVEKRRENVVKKAAAAAADAEGEETVLVTGGDTEQEERRTEERRLEQDTLLARLDTAEPELAVALERGTDQPVADSPRQEVEGPAAPEVTAGYSGGRRRSRSREHTFINWEMKEGQEQDKAGRQGGGGKRGSREERSRSLGRRGSRERARRSRSRERSGGREEPWSSSANGEPTGAEGRV